MSLFRKTAALVCAIGLLAAFSAGAQEWPTRVVKFVSPSLRQPFIVENRTAASGQQHS